MGDTENRLNLEEEVMRKRKAFTLVELMIVLAIIAIIAAFAIPNLMKSRMSANETSAVGSLRNLRDPSAVRETCVEINRLENQGDQVNRAALSKLFQMHDQPIEALKWRDIHGHIETAIDKCEDVADILESIMLKNA